MPLFKKRRVSKKKSYRKKSVRGGRKSSGVSFAVKKYVKKTIHTKTENKMIQYSQNDFFGNVVNDGTMNITPLTPYAGWMSIVQGVGQANRIGNQVSTRRVMLKYVMLPTSYNATTNSQPRPVEVQMFLGYVKQAPSILPTGADFDNLFQFNNTDNPATGAIFDLNQPINKDYWTVKKYWTHKIGFANYAGNGSALNQQTYANNDFKLNVIRKIDITKHYPKKLLFNDNVGTIQNTGLFFFFQAIAADGTVFSGSQLPILMQWQLDLEYEDA